MTTTIRRSNPTGDGMTFLLATLAVFAIGLVPSGGRAQSADWQTVIWREPQVRYLLADMTGGGKVELYRKYATEEKDPDSREALRLWDAGVRVVNLRDFERRWVTNRLAKDGRAFRVVLRGTSRTITGQEVILSSDGEFSQADTRLVLLDLTLGASASAYSKRQSEPAVAEALRLWKAGGRAANARLFSAQGEGTARRLIFVGGNHPADAMQVRLNSDVPYPEVNVRYFMADVGLGGSIEFYRRVAEEAHEMGCLEAVRRIEEGYAITNLDQFERKKVDGKTVVTRKGSDQRISGSEVKLNSD